MKSGTPFSNIPQLHVGAVKNVFTYVIAEIQEPAAM